MTAVLYSERSTPIAANSGNTAFSNNVKVAWDFTGIGALGEGVPWVYQGATAPTLAKTGTETLTTVNGEPSRVASASSFYQYSNTSNYGLQVGAGDFSLAIRFNTPSATPTDNDYLELIRIYGSAGTCLSLQLSNYYSGGSGGFYVIPNSGSTTIPFGSTQSAVVYGANTTVTVWVIRTSGVVTIYTQDSTAQTNATLRVAGGATATTAMDSTWCESVLINNSVGGGSPPISCGITSVKFWSVAHSTGTMNAIGKDYWDSEANTHSSDSIAITSPSASTTIPRCSTISGTYAGTVPTGVQVQQGSSGWVTGTAMTIGSGTWSGNFVLPNGSSNTLQAREVNNNSTLSATVASIVVSTDNITFTAPSTTASAQDYRIFQRDGSRQASVRISGTYSGSPTTLEYQWDGGSWVTLDAAPASNVFDKTIALTGPKMGHLYVRFSNATGTLRPIQSVGVGDVYMVAGQSNHVGGGAGTYVPPVLPGSHPTWAASEYAKNGTWRANVETSGLPFSDTTGAVYSVQGGAPAYDSYFGKLATLCMAAGFPVAFVPCAYGSTYIADWAPSTSTSTLYGAMIAVANTIGSHRALLFWLGESNCGGGPDAGGTVTFKSTMQTALGALVDDWFSRFGTKTVLMNINATGCSTGNSGTGSTDYGFNAMHAAIAYVAANNAHVAGIADMNGQFSSSVHYTTLTEINNVAATAYTPLKSNWMTPRAIGVLVDAGNSPIVSASGLKWKWFDDPSASSSAAPTATGTAGATDASGNISLDLTGTTLNPGQVGRLQISNSDGTTTQSPVAKAFSYPVAVS